MWAGSEGLWVWVAHPLWKVGMMGRNHFDLGGPKLRDLEVQIPSLPSSERSVLGPGEVNCW